MKKSFRFLMVVLVAGIVLSGCVLPPNQQNARIVLSLFVRSSDLPAGWHEASSFVDDVTGAEARFRVWTGPNGDEEPWVNATQVLALFPDEELATAGFSDLESRYIPTAKWYTPDALLESGQRGSQAHTACLDSLINGQMLCLCRTVAQYGRVVTVISANVIPEGAMTYADYRALLQAGDEILFEFSNSDHG